MTKNKEEDYLKLLQSNLYNSKLKEIKEDLGKECTFVSNYIDSKGSRFVRAVVKKQEHLFEVPYDLGQIKNSDYDYLKELIKSKCDE